MKLFGWLLTIKKFPSHLLGPEDKIAMEFFCSLVQLSFKKALPYIFCKITNDIYVPSSYLSAPRNGKMFGAKMKHMGKIAGAPDYFFAAPGSFFIELKADKGKLSPEQETFKEWCEATNVGFYVARSSGEAMEIVERERLKLNL